MNVMSQAGDPTPDGHEIDIQWGVPREATYPEDALLKEWISATLEYLRAPPSEVSVRLMSGEEIATLNQTYRATASSTNVLSFPGEGVDEAGRKLLGDIAVCCEVLAEEAPRQGKALPAHFAHMLVHGVLHLSGYDHIEESEASAMEKLETEIMAHFGFPDPWADLADDEASNK